MQNPVMQYHSGLDGHLSVKRHLYTHNILFVKLSVTLWLDACEYGIGGYSKNGLARQWRITTAWHGKLKLKLLELLASSVTIYMSILRMGKGSPILEFTDNSSALGWMNEASFDPVNTESHDTVAHWLVWTLVSNKTSLY